MPDDLIVHHPPERGAPTRRSVVVYMCCTSCCCLHTAGALLGALLGGGLARRPDDPGFDPQRVIPGVHWLFDRLPRTQWTFWSSLLAVVGLSVPVWVWNLQTRPLEEIVVWTFVIVLVFGPGYVLAAWIVSLIRLAIGPAGSVGSHEYWALHRTLGWALFGAVMGMALMGMLAKPMGFQFLD
ncbi:MAG: hypothetical protein ACK6D3_14055 [Planctomycetaceae bacterium]|jgi:hypothetical protein